MSVCVCTIRARSSPAPTSTSLTPVLASADNAPSLSKLTVRELAALCEERGLEAPARAKKADLIALLEASHG